MMTCKLTHVRVANRDFVHVKSTGHSKRSVTRIHILPWSAIEEIITKFAIANVEERNTRVQKLLKEIEDERDEI